MTELQPLKYVPFEDKEVAGDWRVEAIDSASGSCYIVIFVGLDAEFRAREYAGFKNAGNKLVVKNAPEPEATKRITVKLTSGEDVTFDPGTLSWTWVAKKKTLTAVQKPLIEISEKTKGKN